MLDTESAQALWALGFFNGTKLKKGVGLRNHPRGIRAPHGTSGTRIAVAQSIGRHHLAWTRRTEVMMPKEKLSPEGEVIAAYGAAMVAAFQVLLNCLEENDALLPGQFADALAVYMEMVKSRQGDVSEMTLAVLHDIRKATLT